MKRLVYSLFSADVKPYAWMITLFSVAKAVAEAVKRDGVAMELPRFTLLPLTVNLRVKRSEGK